MVSKPVEDSVCPIPWIHTSMDSRGDMRMCCMANLPPFAFFQKENREPYNAEFDTIPRNHKVSKDTRAKMIRGERPEVCRQCWILEDSGLISNRMVNLIHFYPGFLERALDLTQEDGTIDPIDFPIKYYDLRFGTKCNCRCIICNSGNSSMWNYGKVVDWSNDLDTPYMDELIDNIENIDRLYITGGEPMINKNHWRLINLLIESDLAKNINLDYNSNGVVLTKEMLNKWGKFKIVNIGFSIDGMNETFEKIRKPAKWSVVEKNLDLFEQHSHPNTNASFAMTIFSVNILHLIDFFKWIFYKKFKKFRLEPHFNILSRPLEYDIRNLSYKKKQIIKHEYEKLYEWVSENCPSELVEDLNNNFKGLINAMMTRAPSDRS